MERLIRISNDLVNKAMNGELQTSPGNLNRSNEAGSRG